MSPVPDVLHHARRAQKAGKPVGRHAKPSYKAGPSAEEKWLHSHLRLAADLAVGGPHDVILYGDDIVEAWRCAAPASAAKEQRRLDPPSPMEKTA